MDGKQRIDLEWPYVFVIVLQFHYTHVYTVQYYGTGDKLVQPTSIYIYTGAQNRKESKLENMHNTMALSWN